jgi:hypothetical protein
MKTCRDVRYITAYKGAAGELLLHTCLHEKSDIAFLGLITTHFPLLKSSASVTLSRNEYVSHFSSVGKQRQLHLC